MKPTMLLIAILFIAFSETASSNETMDIRVYDDIIKTLAVDHFDVSRLEKTPQQWDAMDERATKPIELITPYFSSLAVAIALMSLLWVLSLFIKDASVVDRFWGLGFILMSIQQLLENRFLTFRVGLILVLVTIWGIRLSLHIHFRNRGKPEDSRYQQMRQAQGASFWWSSYFMVFGLQGLLMWIIAAPLAVMHLFPQSDVPTILDFLGVAVWGIGFLWEAIADYQLVLFKRKPENRGKVCRVGLWNLSRHPNYFGESLVWWGYFLIALNVDYGWATIFSPILMLFLLLRVSGVSLLEKHLSSTKPGYAEYVRTVPAFFPFTKRQ